MEDDPIDFAPQAEDGVPDIPLVAVNRATAEELELRRMQRTQTTCLFVLAVATGLGLAYIAKMVLVVLFASILLAFVLAPVVDFGVRFGVPRSLGSLFAVFLLLGAV